MEIDKKLIGNRIKSLRLENKMTQENLALLLGLKGKSSIANYEAGKIIPSDKVKLHICDIFNCPMEYLLGTSNTRTLFDFDDWEKQAKENNKKYNNKQKSNLTYNKKTSKSILQDFENKELNELKKQLQAKNISNSQIEKLMEYLSNSSNKLTYEFEDFLNTLQPEVKDFIIHFNFDSSLKMLQYTKDKFYLCPVYGQISAGQPNWAEECIDGYLPIDPNLMNIVNPDECFFLKVNGESMNKVVRNGAYALIRKTDFVENGEIAVVLVNRI